MNALTRRWSLRLVLASGLTFGALALGSVPAEAAPAEPAPVGPTTVVAGQTSQGFPSYFKVSPNGKTLRIGQVMLGMSCASGNTVAQDAYVTQLPIGANGRAHTAGEVPPTVLPDGATASGTESMDAKLNRKRTQVTGIWRLRLSYTFADGTTDQCDSGLVRFTDGG